MQCNNTGLILLLLVLRPYCNPCCSQCNFDTWAAMRGQTDLLFVVILICFTLLTHSLTCSFSQFKLNRDIAEMLLA